MDMKLSDKALRIRADIVERGISHCKGITPKQMETILSLNNEYGYNSGIDFATGKDMTSLLTIELQDESSVPKVIYKGKEIKNRVNVSFDWDTADAHGPGGLSYAIEHMETGNGQVTTNRIERRCGDHA